MDTLYFDADCPVCKSFSKLLAQKISPDKLTLQPISSDDLEKYREFYILVEGQALIGQDAIQYLSSQYPEIKEFFWMLPPQYRHQAIKSSLRIARWIRRWILGKRDCNCN